ncbi:hypothetical protein KUTeg_021716 [Tegillarca granosa]|uniref:Uncharacterized protein n=1 Tax=Tegillarca granosa TaxID=220873 RepID=A0ABQ9E8K7_TEGGR|nr:hypothetical protein KUTeg_021716 [Tegillarca granosa]
MGYSYVQNGWIEEQTPKEKRYAMLSYNYGGGRNNYYNDYYRKRYRYRTQWKPWLTLPDRRCYRDRCSSDRDCCKRYNKCDAYLKIAGMDQDVKQVLIAATDFLIQFSSNTTYLMKKI